MTPPLPERLRELAERCEQATGPDRVLDAEIYVSLDGERGNLDALEINGDVGPWVSDYTASLDAAMTLVPEGWTFEAYQGPSGQPNLWTLRTRADGDKTYTSRSGKGKTPALALCAAALRARAQSGGDHD